MAQARVRAARLTDLPFLLAGAAEQGAIAARGDAMVNNNDFFTVRFLYLSNSRVLGDDTEQRLPSPRESLPPIQP